MNPHRIIVPLLILITGLTFWRVTLGGYVYYDDDEYVFANPHVLQGLTAQTVKWAFGFTPDHAGNYHPLTWLSLMLDGNVLGAKPRSYHLTNMLLHVLAVVLLYSALCAMTGSPWRSGLVALLFGIHPLRVESVAWISERKDVLCACLALAAITAYALYARRPGWGRYLWVVVFFILGLLAKPMLVTLPCLLLLLDIWPLRRLAGLALPAPSDYSPVCAPVCAPLCPPRPVGRLVLEKIPFFLLSAAASVVTYVVQLQSGAVHGLHELPTSLRLANTPMSYVRYLGKMVWFDDLTLLYPFPIWHFWQVAAATALLLLITCVALIRFRPNPWLAIGWFWYLGMLVPVIGLVQMGTQAMADRYSYLPTIGLLIMLIWSLPELLFQAQRGRVALGGATLAIAAILSIFTWRQIGYWHDSVTLLTRVIKFSPNDQVALMNLGMALDDQGKGSLEGLVYLRKAVAVGPNFPRAQFMLGITLEHYSVSLRDELFFREALDHLRRASELQPRDAVPHNAMGRAYLEHRQLDQAMTEFQKAAALDRNFVPAHVYMGDILARLNRLDEAMKEFQRALDLNPDDPAMYAHIAMTLAHTGRFQEAIPYFQKAAQRAPANPTYRAMLEKAEDAAQHQAALLRPMASQPFLPRPSNPDLPHADPAMDHDSYSPHVTECGSTTLGLR